ncbi:hypothetical protein S7711_04357 [Stachybotrys chartarum IBT 7711]|uniref:Dihydrofolate reductase n=1 Tax=Stachybotrys chartarum (strain CBS 109288 / IBT 7711) TaxID=1280523 RepID=A0A084AY69_STACB|nr:hypothetical protein S7711_04357 [Stachybotrys chartarum IBT 7711]
MGAGRIDCYLDIASFFSYIAFSDLLPNLDTLAAHGIEVEFHPTFIGGIVSITGNQPPWKNAHKGRYLTQDSRRAARRVSQGGIAFPKDFMAMNTTVSPLRALHYIKRNFPAPTFLSAMHYLNHRFWTPPHDNLTVDAVLEAVLLDATETPGGGRRLFTREDVARIMEGREGMKEALKATTARAVELGAFGAPWLWAVNDKGEGAPFFGSDRFNHIYEHLGVPYQDVALLPPSNPTSNSSLPHSSIIGNSPPLGQNMQPLELTLIVAATRNMGIGAQGGMPWKGLRKEMQYFARVTTRLPPQSPPGAVNAVIMGRKTWDSIPPKFRPLKGRLNIVVSRSAASAPPASTQEPVRVASLEQALQVAQQRAVGRVFVMGGAQIYDAALALPAARRVLLTSIERHFDCDTFFPLRLGGRDGAQAWVRRSRAELQDWTGEEVVEGGQEEAGTRYEFQMWEKIS